MKRIKNARQVKALAMVRTLKQSLAHAEGLLVLTKEYDDQIADGASYVPDLQAKIKALDADNKQLRLHVSTLEAQLKLQSSSLDSVYFKELDATGDAVDALPIESILPVRKFAVGKMAGAVTRLRNALKNLGIKTIGELRRSNIHSLENNRWMVKSSLEMLVVCMKHHRIEFAPAPPSYRDL